MTVAYRIFVVTKSDGSQVYVREWDGGALEAAERRDGYETWGPPTLEVRVEGST